MYTMGLLSSRGMSKREKATAAAAAAALARPSS